jgi:hypothetical protein
MKEPNWSAVQTARLLLTTDLLYFDIVLPANLKWLPVILKRFGQEMCYIFNHDRLIRADAEHLNNVAIEITANCEPSAIAHELSNFGKNHDRYLSVFYFIGYFGILSADGSWFIFARTDDRALFSTNSEELFSEFNTSWWSYLSANRDATE